MNYNLVNEWDGAFNLTAREWSIRYRRFLLDFHYLLPVLLVPSRYLNSSRILVKPSLVVVKQTHMAKDSLLELSFSFVLAINYRLLYKGYICTHNKVFIKKTRKTMHI